MKLHKPLKQIGSTVRVDENWKIIEKPIPICGDGSECEEGCKVDCLAPKEYWKGHDAYNNAREVAVLCKMTEFNELTYESIPEPTTLEHTYIAFNNVLHYSRSITKPLHISQFIPCDENGVPLEKPRFYDIWVRDGKKKFHHTDMQSLFEQYSETESRVLFDGWEYLSASTLLKNGTIKCHCLESKIDASILRFDEDGVIAYGKSASCKKRNWKVVEDLVNSGVILILKQP